MKVVFHHSGASLRHLFFISLFFFVHSNAANALSMQDFFCIKAPLAVSFFHETGPDQATATGTDEGYCSVNALCVYASHEKAKPEDKSEYDLVEAAQGSAEKYQIIVKKHGQVPNVCATGNTDWFSAYLSCPSVGWVDNQGKPITDPGKIASCKRLEHSKVLPKPCYRSCPAPENCKNADPKHEQGIAVMAPEDYQSIGLNPTGLFKVTPASKAK